MTGWVNRIFNHTCERMAELPDESVHCVVTSPPYLGLRAYNGEDGMIGLEGSIPEYLDKMSAVFQEVHRVLRPDGVVFVNMGDSYNAGTSAPRRPSKTVEHGRFTQDQGEGDRRVNARGDGLKVKDEMLMPHRLVMRLQEDGWWVRDTIIYAKTNPMPSSVTDRCTPAFEYVFMLTKRARYFVGMDAVREPLAESSLQRIIKCSAAMEFDRGGGGPRHQQRAQQRKARGVTPVNPDAHEGFDNRWSWENRKLRGAPPRHGVDGVRESEIGPRYKTAGGVNPRGLRQAPEPGEQNAFHPLGANARNVWPIATEPFKLCRYGCNCGWYAVTDAKVADRKDAPGKPDVKCPNCGAWLERDSHYATMPTKLAKQCIKIGTSEGGCCSRCGAPRRRVTDVSYGNPGNRTTNGDRNVENRDFSPGFESRLERVATTTGFEPTCECSADSAPCTVLDPFMGVGTTMAAAFDLGRRAVGYEISQKYIQIAECRPQIRETREYEAALRGESLPPVAVLPLLEAPLLRAVDASAEGAA